MIPAEIQVGAIRYRIELKKNLVNLGKHNAPKQLIRLRSTQGPDQLRDSLLHEVMHAALFNTNLIEMAGYGVDTEEAIVRAVTPILLDLLERNPGLVDYLTRRDENTP